MERDLEPLQETGRHSLLTRTASHSQLAGLAHTRLPQEVEQVPVIELGSWPQDVELGRTDADRVVQVRLADLAVLPAWCDLCSEDVTVAEDRVALRHFRESAGLKRTSGSRNCIEFRHSNK